MRRLVALQIGQNLEQNMSLFAAVPSFLLHTIPLVAIVSLVYAATRHESMQPILHHAVRTALWIIGFVAVIFAILWIISAVV